MKDRTELTRLLHEAAAHVAAMTPEAREEMFRAQRESWVRSIALWPKAKFKWIDGVKVYDSLEDYYND